MKPRIDRQAAADASLVFGLASALTYLLERAYEQMRGQASDPTLILETLHTTFYWRAAIAAWWGGVVALVCYVLFARNPRPRSSRLAMAAALLAPALVAWFYLLP